jgi:anaerobic ribonucleoside-triphosphate reductase activating protein
MMLYGGNDMRYHNITKDDMLNGDGLRVVLWVAGCSHHCDECQNPVTWNPNGGIPFGEKDKAELFEQLGKSYVSGVTFSGGDPLFEINEPEILALAKEIRAQFPEKTIWLYTGYLWEYVKSREIAQHIDVLVDGPYMKQLRDTKLHWRGSANQRVIDVKASLAAGKVVLHCE